MWRRGEAMGAMACHPYAGDGERLPRSGRGLSAVERWCMARAGADAGRASLPSCAKNGALAQSGEKPFFLL
jgi:hypothetical protein